MVELVGVLKSDYFPYLQINRLAIETYFLYYKIYIYIYILYIYIIYNYTNDFLGGNILEDQAQWRNLVIELSYLVIVY